MKNINRVVIAGNLTRDAEIKRTQSGLAVMTASVAVNDSRKNQSTGEWEDYANFIDCVMMGERAEKLASHLPKGTRVAIEGKLRQSRWEKDGQKRSKIEVIIDQIEFMSRRLDAQSAGDYSVEAAIEAAGPSAMDTSYYDSDIPF